MRWIELVERAPQTVAPTIFALMKAAHAHLSAAAQDAVKAWETTNWTGGSLEQHIAANDAVAAEIEAAFAPIRAKLPPTVTLYRGIIRDGYSGWEKSLLQSWTSDRRTAELFAGLRYGEEWKSLLHDDITDEQITAAVAKYDRTGFVRFRNRYYVRNREQPRYYNIYDRDRQFVTDGDDLADDLQQEQQHRREANADKQQKAHVFEEEIARERIIWITNRLNCKEFLVARSDKAVQEGYHDGDEVDYDEAAERVVAAVRDFAANLPITVELRPYARHGITQGVILTELYAREPGGGIGSQVMQLMCSLADEEGISLYTDAEGPRSKAFYERFGFERGPGQGQPQLQRLAPLPRSYFDD